MIDKVNDYFVKADRVCDYIPIVSTVSNLADIFQKAILHLVDLLKSRAQSTSLDNKYFTHIKNKRCARCVLWTVPFIGNLTVAIFDHIKTRDKFVSRLEQWASPSVDRKQIAKNIISALKNNKSALNFSGYNLGSLPPEIGKLTQLEILRLHNINIEKLPAEIGKLNNLRCLWLQNNKLKKLPPELGQLNQLEYLDLKENKLKTLPTKIGQLPQLKGLGLEDNDLEEIPVEIGKLTQLRFLNFGNNRLGKVPSIIGMLTQLEGLGLAGNQLKELSYDISSLKKLKQLDVSRNPELTELPSSLGQIPTLTHINIEGTCISEVRRDAILSQCKALQEKQP